MLGRQEAMEEVGVTRVSHEMVADARHREPVDSDDTGGIPTRQGRWAFGLRESFLLPQGHVARTPRILKCNGLHLAWDSFRGTIGRSECCHSERSGVAFGIQSGLCSTGEDQMERPWFWIYQYSRIALLLASAIILVYGSIRSRKAALALACFAFIVAPVAATSLDRIAMRYAVRTGREADFLNLRMFVLFAGDLLLLAASISLFRMANAKKDGKGGDREERGQGQPL